MVFPIAAAIGAGGSILGGALGGGLLGGSKAPKPSKWWRNNVKDLYGRASDIADQPFEAYTGERFADFTPDQTAGFDLIRNSVGNWAPELDRASSGLGAAAAYQPGTVSSSYRAPGTFGQDYQAPSSFGSEFTYQPTQMTNTYQAPSSMGSAFNYSPTSVSAERIKEERIGSKNFTDYDINKYMNPYISGVIDTSLSDIERARQETENAQKADMLAAGAWGGSRSGVAQSLTNREYANTAASTAANLRARGFDTAAGLIGQDANRLLAADQSNQAANLAAKQTNASLALQAGIANQVAGLDAAKFGADYGLRRDMAVDDSRRFGSELDFRIGDKNNFYNLDAAKWGSDLGLRRDIAKDDANRFAAGYSLDRDIAADDSRRYESKSLLDADMFNVDSGIAGNNSRISASLGLADVAGSRSNLTGNDAARLLESGGIQQDDGQRKRDFEFAEWARSQGFDAAQLDFLKGYLTDPAGVGGGMAQPNPWLGAMGGAVTGLNLANSIYGAWNNYRPQTYSYNNTLPPGVDSYDSYGNYGG